MKYTTSALARLVLVLGLAAILAPAAFGKGGGTARTYAPPPLDAGSAVPNPDYARISPYARVSRGSTDTPARHATVVSRSTGDAFDWGDAGIGAGGALIVLLCVAPLLLVIRQSGSKSLART